MIRRLSRRFRLFCMVALMAGLALPAAAYVTGTPVPTDSRIKTFVYHANDVYRVLTHYNYQMNIEFAEDETIDTISVGNRVGWHITPTENRLFIRAMNEEAHTNMTVITDKRSYQFDLVAAEPGEQGWDELVYVVRFYYPEEGGNQFANIPPQAGPMMASYPAPAPSQPPMMMQPAPMVGPPPMNPSMGPRPNLSQIPRIGPPPMMPQQPMASLPPPPPALMPQAPMQHMPPPPMMQQQAPQPPAMPSFSMPQMPQMPPMMPPQPQAMPQQAPRMMQGLLPAPHFGGGQAMIQPQLPPLPSAAPPPMASPSIMAQPATPVPPVRVQRRPYGMLPPPNVSVAPPVKIPHPRSPFVANQMTEDAQTLARKYPKGSYENSNLAPRQLPTLEDAMRRPDNASVFDRIQKRADRAPGSLPLPSAIPKNYIHY